MAEGGDFDEHEMEEREAERREEEEEDEEETNLDDEDDDEMDTDDGPVTIKRPSGDIPRVGKDVGDIRRSMTWEKKRFFEKYQNFDIKTIDGPWSADLLKRTKILYDKKDRIRGLSFDGVQVLVGSEERGFRLTDNRRNRRKASQYLDRLDRAKEEHDDALEEVEGIITRTSGRVEDRVEKRDKALQYESEEANLSEENAQKFAETLNPRGTDDEKIKSLEENAEYFEMQALGETDPIKRDFYEGVSRTAKLNADGIRLKMGLRPEHDEANTILTEERVVTPDIISLTSERVDDLVETRMKELEEDSGEIHLDEQDIREFAGTLNPVGTNAEKIEALEINAEHFRMKALRETDPAKEAFYKGVSETAELSADKIRLEMGLKPEHDEAKAILNDEIDKDDLGRLERFKRWARGNLLGLSAIAITIAGLITTVVMGVRKAVTAGAKATGRFAKALAKLAKEAGPLLSGLLNLLAQIVSLVARAVSWLAGNLWVLAVAFAWYVYERQRNKTYERRRNKT